MESYSSTKTSTQIGCYTASSKEDGSVTINLLIRAMYPVNLSGDCLCLHSDVGVPTCFVASSLNLLASVVCLLPCLMDGSAWVFYSTPWSSACACSISWGSSVGTYSSSSTCKSSSLSRDNRMAFSSSNFISRLTTINMMFKKYTQYLWGVSYHVEIIQTICIPMDSICVEIC